MHTSKLLFGILLPAIVKAAGFFHRDRKYHIYNGSSEPLAKIIFLFPSVLMEAHGTVCLRVFADRKDDVFTGSKLNVECGKFATMEDALKKHNEQNRGIFYVVNYGGQDDESITRIPRHFRSMIGMR